MASSDTGERRRELLQASGSASNLHTSAWYTHPPALKAEAGGSVTLPPAAGRRHPSMFHRKSLLPPHCFTLETNDDTNAIRRESFRSARHPSPPSSATVRLLLRLRPSYMGRFSFECVCRARRVGTLPSQLAARTLGFSVSTRIKIRSMYFCDPTQLCCVVPLTSSAPSRDISSQQTPEAGANVKSVSAATTSFAVFDGSNV